MWARTSPRSKYSMRRLNVCCSLYIGDIYLKLYEFAVQKDAMNVACKAELPASPPEPPGIKINAYLKFFEYDPPYSSDRYNAPLNNHASLRNTHSQAPPASLRRQLFNLLRFCGHLKLPVQPQSVPSQRTNAPS